MRGYEAGPLSPTGDLPSPSAIAPQPGDNVIRRGVNGK